VTKLERVQQSISRRIESGTLRQGDRLPSEEQLAVQFRVSVGTVQKALDRLASARLLSREHGRGTFVSGVPASEVSYLRFRDDKGQELPNFIQFRSAKRLKRPGPWSEHLGGAPPFVRIERRISVGGRFENASEFWLREAEFDKLAAGDRRTLERNLRVQLWQRLALPTLRVDQSIRFEPLPRTVADDLGLARDEPGFVMEMRGYTLRDQPLFYHRVFSAAFTESLVIVR
jgi:DNA-binding GntR family transcriptional regulator